MNQKKLMDFCKENGIAITAYSPLGSPDRPWAKPGEPGLLDDKKLQEMAKKLGKSAAQLVIRYQVIIKRNTRTPIINHNYFSKIERGNVVIPKSVHKTRMAENLDVFDFKLTAEDMKHLDSFDCNGRVCAELK